MATVNKVKIVNEFKDDTTRDIEFSGFKTGDAILDPNTLRNRIKALNSDTSIFSDTYLSDAGKPFSKISAATITKTSETEIALHSGE